MSKTRYPDMGNWWSQAFETNLGFLIAPEDYFEGNKYLFSWMEGEAIENKIAREFGWRRMTAKELALILVEYGTDAQLRPLVEEFETRLELNQDCCYWTSTICRGGIDDPKNGLAIAYQKLQLAPNAGICGLHNIHTKPFRTKARLRLVRDFRKIKPRRSF